MSSQRIMYLLGLDCQYFSRVIVRDAKWLNKKKW
jgi:hypothetical protein